MAIERATEKLFTRKNTHLALQIVLKIIEQSKDGLSPEDKEFAMNTCKQRLIELINSKNDLETLEALKPSSSPRIWPA